MTAPYASSRYAYEGTETTEISIVRTGGATDPNGQAQSRKIVTTANAQWLRPFRCEPWAIWNETTGANVTVTVYGNGASVPASDEVWLECSYLGSASSTLGSIVSTTKANVLATGAAGTSDSSSWAGGTTAFKLVATLSSPQPGRPGLIHVRPKIGKANATFYLDPKIELSPVSTTALMASTHKSSRYAYEGTETTETSIVRTGGTPHSRKIVTTANSQWLRPYRAEPFAIWNATTGADVTVTVYGLALGGLPLNDEAFLECSYLGSASSTLGSIVSTTKSNVLAAGAPVASDSSVWPVVSMGFDSATASNVAVSNGNLTATHTNTTYPSGARSLFYATTGKYYFEVTMTTVSGASDAVGLITSTGTFTNVSSSLESSRVIKSSGNIYSNNAFSSYYFGAIANGDVIGVAVDLDARLIWFRKNNGYWQGHVDANPVTAVRGIVVEATKPFAPMVYFGDTGSAAGDNMTANFGATAYANAAPSGFGNWTAPTYTPFKLVATLNGVPALTAPPSGPFLDSVASLTGAWSLSRNMRTAFSSTRYTKLSGSSINALKDQSGNSRDLANAGAASVLPTESTAFPGGILCADFDGVNDFLGGVSLLNFLTSDGNGAMVATIIIDAVTINSATPKNNHMIMADDARYLGLSARNNGGVLTFYAHNYSGGDTSVAITGTVGTAYVIMWRHYAGQLYVSLNGGAETAVASGNTPITTNPLNMGGTSGAYWCDMKLAEAFTTNDGSQTAALAAAIANMLAYANGPVLSTPANPQPGQPGLINVRVKAGKPLATYYIDPTPELS